MLPGPRIAGLQETTESGAGTSTLKAAVWVLLPRVAVTDAFRLLAMEAAAVALKVPVVAPAATETAAGTVSRRTLLLASMTRVPPAGAVWVSVTVHVLTAPALNSVGVQVTGRRDGTLIDPAPAEVMLRPFPRESVPSWFDT
jgi:hypothetical protein